MVVMDAFDIRCELEARIKAAEDDMREARLAGVNSPAFNQELGRRDALWELLEWIDDE